MKSLFLALIILFFISYIFPLPISAKVWINEFYSGSTDDWVEFYNDAEDSVALDNYRMRDNSSTNSLDLHGQIDAKGYRVFEWTGKLNNGGDTIKIISKNDESIVYDQIVYGNDAEISSPVSGQSAGRQIDGDSIFVLFSRPSKSAQNSIESVVPTATPIPENTPTPTRAPTPTRVPTPTRIPTPTKIQQVTDDLDEEEQVSNTTLAKSKSQKKTLKISGAPTPILGIATKSATAKISNKVSPRPSNQSPVKKSLSPPYFILASGVIFMTACAILIFQRRRRR